MGAIIPGRMIVEAVLVAAALATGWIKGAEHESRNADRFAADVRATGHAAQARAARIVKRQTTLNQETNDAHRAGLDLLRSHYGLRLTDTGGGALPNFSASPLPPGPGPADPGPVAAGPAERLTEACAETTLMFVDLRNAWRGQISIGTEP